MAFTFTKDVLDTSQINPSTGLTFTKDTGGSSYIGDHKSPIDVSEYDKFFDYGVHLELGVSYLDKRRADEQSSLDQFGNMLNQAVVGSFIGGTVEAVGHLFALEDAYKLVTNQEVDLGNWLVDLGIGLREWTEKVTPIYKDPSIQGQFRPDKWSWWMEDIMPSILSTLSLLIPVTGVIKVASMVGKALGIGGKMTKAAKALRAAGKVQDALVLEKKIQQANWLRTGLSQAVVSREVENLMEAKGKYDEIVKRGGSREQASLAASDIYKANWVMLIQDIPQYLTLGAGLGKVFKKTSAKMAAKMGTIGATEASFRTTGKLALDWGGEAVEEGYQYIVSENADEMSKAAMNPDYKPKELAEYLKEGDFWTAAFAGMFGAGVFQSVGRHINKKILGVQDMDDKKLSSMKKQAMFDKMYFDYIIAADKQGDVQTAEEMKDDWIITKAGMALGIGDGVNTLQQNIELLEQIAATEQLSEEDMELTGLDEESLAYMKEKFPDFIDSIKEVGTTYETIVKDPRLKDKKNKEIVAGNIAANTVLQRRLYERLANNKEQLQEIEGRLNKITAYGELTSNGKQIFNLQQERNAIGSTRQVIKNQLKGRLTKEKREELINYDKKLVKQQDKLDKERKDLISQEGYKGTDEQKSDVANNKLIEDSLKEEYFSKLSEIKNNEKAIDSKVNTIKELWKTDPKVEKIKPEKTPEQVKKDEEKRQAQEKETKQNAEDEAEKFRTENDKRSAKKVKESLSKKGNYVGAVASVDGNPVQGYISKKDDGYYISDMDTGESYKLDLDPNSSWAKQGITVLEDPTDPSSKQSTAKKEDDITEADNSEVKEGEPIVKEWDGNVVYEVGYRLDDPANDEINAYISDKNNDLSGAVIEPFIDYEYLESTGEESLLKRLKSGNTAILTEEDIQKTPLGARLVMPDGKVIPGKMWLYSEQALRKSAQKPKAEQGIPTKHYKAYGKKFLQTAKDVRKNIVPLLAQGKKVQFPDLGRTKGAIRGRKTNLNVFDTLDIDIKDAKGVVGTCTRKGQIRGVNGSLLGTIDPKAVGTRFLVHNDTANGKDILVKLNNVRLKNKGTQYADIIWSTFQQSLNSEVKQFSEIHKSEHVEGKLKNINVLDYLIQWGKGTALNNKEVHPPEEQAMNSDRYDELRKKQIYYDHIPKQKTGVIFYGSNENDINPKTDKPNPHRIKTNTTDQKQIDRFKDYITENLNFVTRNNDFPNLMPKMKLGDIKVTDEDVKNKLTNEQFILREGYVLYESEIKDAYITVDTNQFEEVITPDEKNKPKPTPLTDAKSLDDFSEDFLKDLEDIDGIENELNRLYKGETKYQNWNAAEEIEHVRKIVGENIPINITEDFIRTLSDAGSHRAWGQVKNGSIYLYKNAEKGTGYHESFHVVTQYFLTAEERKSIYNNAKKSYKQLQGATDSVVEEFLAEEFRKYVIGLPTETKLTDKIRKFFKRLLDFIEGIFIDRATRISNLTMEQLFNKIETGQFKPTKSNKHYSGANDIHSYLSEEFTLEQVNKITDGLFYQLVTLNNLISIEDIDNIDFKVVYDKMQSLVNKFSSIADNTNRKEQDRIAADRLANLYSRIISDDLWGKFETLMEQRLLAMGVKRKEAFGEDTDDVTSKEFKRFDSATYEYDSKDTVLNNVKLFIATLPARNKRDKFTGMMVVLDFHNAWSRIMKDAWKARNINDIERILQNKSQRSQFYKSFLNGTKTRWGIKNAPEEFRTQIEAAFNKYKHSYLNLVHETKRHTDENGNVYVTHSYKTYSAEVETSEKTVAREWSFQFYENGNKGKKFYDKEDKPVLSELNKVSDKFLSGIYEPVNTEYNNKSNIEEYDQYKRYIKGAFNSISIELEEYTIDDIFEDLGNGNKQKGMHKFVNEIMLPIFDKSGSFIGDVKTGKALIHQKTKRDIPIEQSMSNNSNIQKLAELVVKHNSDYVQDVVPGPDDGQFYVYSQSNYMTEWSKRNYIFNSETGKIELSKEFKELRDGFYNNHSYFINKIENGSELLIKTIANYRTDSNNKDYLKLTDREDFLLKLNLMLEGYMPMPTFADRKFYGAFEGIDPLTIDLFELDENGNVIIPKQVQDILYGYVEDEKVRIDRVKSDIDDAIDTGNYRNLVQNMHYLTVDNNGVPGLTKGGYDFETKEYLQKDKPLYDANGLKYHVFTNLNDGKAVTFESIRELMKDRINDTIDTAVKLGVVSRIEDGNLKNKSLSSKRLAEYKKNVTGAAAKINETNAIKAMLAEYTINTIVTGVETDKLIVGDPAFYKADKKGSVIEDKIKRINGPVAPGDKLRVEYPTEHEFGNKTKYPTATLQDYKIYADELIENLRVRFKAQGLSDAEVNERLEAYKEVNVTDAQAYITPAFHRELKIRLGEWGDEHQEAYDLIMSGEAIPEDKLELVNRFIMEPLKYVHYGMYSENGYMVPIYDKMSMATLWPSMVSGKKIEALYNRMTNEASPIDMVKFESAVKVGNRPRPQYFNEGEEINQDPIDQIEVYDQDLTNLRRQQVTAPHDTSVRILATQVKRLIMANLKVGTDYIVNGEIKTSSEIAEIFDKSYSALSQKGLEKLQDIIGLDLETGKVDTAKLYEKLRKDAENGNLPQQVIDALLVGDDGKYINLDTLPDRKWVETRLIALAGKYTIDIMAPGDVFIQMSNFGINKGYDDKLKLIDENNQTEIMVSVGLYKNVIPDYYKKTFEEKEDWLEKNKDVIEGIGYRIPTQGQNSIISFKVVGFLDTASGNTVVLPSEFTALNGSDFDIDKLFLATYNYNVIGDKVEKIEFIEAEGEVTDKKLLEEYWKQNNLRDINFVKRLEGITERVEKHLLNEYDQAYLRRKYPNFIDDLGRVKVEEIDKLKNEILDGFPKLEDFIKQSKGKTQYQLNSEQALQNRILDTMKAVMVNENHILETKTPLDTYTSKIKNGEDGIVDIYRELTGKNRSLNSLEAYAPTYQHNVKKVYAGGKDGIPSFAINNVNHPLTQIHNVLLSAIVKDKKGNTTSNYFDFANHRDGKVDLSQQKGVDGLYIIDWLSALINAHLDIAKDPYIFDLNINKRTYGIVNYLIRAGAGEKTFWFMVQPGIIDYTKKWEDIIYTKGKSLGKSKGEIQADIVGASNPRNIFELTTEGYTNAKGEYVKGLQDYIKEGQKPEGERSYDWWFTQIGMYRAYKELSQKSRSLAKFVSLSRTDGKGYGNTTNEVFDFVKDYSKFVNKNSFEGASEILTQSFIGTYGRNATGSIMKIMGEINISATPAFREMYTRLTDTIDKPDPEDEQYKDKAWKYAADIEEYKKKIATLENKLYTQIISDYFNSPIGYNVSQKRYKELFKGKESIGSRLYKLINDNPDLEDNYFIRHIKPVKPLRGDNTEAWLIKALNGDKTDRFQRDNIVDGWANLLEHPKEEVRKIAEDLVIVSFFLSGFSRNLYSFYHNIPIAYLVSRSQFNSSESKTYDEFITHTKEALSSIAMNDESVEKIITDIIANNQELFDPKTVSANVKRSKEKNPYAMISNEKEYHKFIKTKYNVEEADGKIVEKDAFGQYIGTRAKDGRHVYRFIPKKGLSQSGHKAYVFGYNDNIFNEGTTQFTIEKTINLLSNTKDMGVINYAPEYTGIALVQEEAVQPTVTSNFQGYKGGFENTGKGTPEGDGKDKAMREVADGFIGEVVSPNKATSTNTSFNEIGEKARATGSTVWFVEKNSDTAIALPTKKTKTQTVESVVKVVMLARNKEFVNKQLGSDTKQQIDNANYIGAEFVVGDMPNVDSQFIDYLQEIGAKFTIYHTGNTSRIQIAEEKQTVPSTYEELTVAQKFSLHQAYGKDMTEEQIIKVYNEATDKKKSNMLNCL